MQCKNIRQTTNKHKCTNADKLQTHTTTHHAIQRNTLATIVIPWELQMIRE